MAEPTVVTFEDVQKKVTPLDDSDLDAIAAQADKERLAEKKAKEGDGEVEDQDKKPAPKEGTGEGEASEEEKLKAEEKKEKEEAKAAKEAEEKKAEDERILAAKDEDLKDGEKTRKTELLKAKEESDKKAQEDDVKAIAKEYSITEDEAKQSLEHVGKLREKYKDNPKELAKANYFQQKFISKQTEELKTIKSAPKPVDLTIENVIKELDKGNIKTADGNVVTREQAIEAYRKEFADITETVDDETVLKMAAKEFIHGYSEKQKAVYANMQAKAKEKRSAVISSIPAEYLPEIKPIIENLPDQAILGEGFSVDDTILWAKGKKFDSAIKEAEERGFKRGQEQSKILGEKKTPDDKTKSPKAKLGTLTEAQKKRALDMFDGQQISDEEKFKLFLEIEGDKKKKKE